MGLPEELVVNMLGKGARREERWLSLRHRLRQRLQNDLLLGRLAEHRPRNPHLLLVNQSPVKNTLVLTIAENLYGVSNVHDDGVGDAFGGHPLALIEKLQARHHVVEDEGESAHVGVGFHSESQFRLGTFWVVVDLLLK